MILLPWIASHPADAILKLHENHLYVAAGVLEQAVLLMNNQAKTWSWGDGESGGEQCNHGGRPHARNFGRST